MSMPIMETEAFIRFRLLEMSSLNEHHRFEEIATRVAQKRISANILIATGPVSSAGDKVGTLSHLSPVFPMSFLIRQGSLRRPRPHLW